MASMEQLQLMKESSQAKEIKERTNMEAIEPKEETNRLGGVDIVWRRLSIDDIDDLANVANEIHPGLLESNEVFAERVRLFPEGCLALVKLVQGKSDELCGYAISHPIRHRQPPDLDSFLKEIAPDADQYYIHDLAILPSARGRGLAQDCTKKLLAVAERFPTSCLVSVYGTSPFWSKYGFCIPESVDSHLEKKLQGYGDDSIYLERTNPS